MADLKKDNNCLACDYYESEANDHYYQWCHHPKIDNEDNTGEYLYQSEDDNVWGDFNWFVTKCPMTGKSPYGEES